MEYGNSDTKYFRYIQIGSNIFEIPRNSIFEKQEDKIDLTRISFTIKFQYSNFWNVSMFSKLF